MNEILDSLVTAKMERIHIRKNKILMEPTNRITKLLPKIILFLCRPFKMVRLPTTNDEYIYSKQIIELYSSGETKM